MISATAKPATTGDKTLSSLAQACRKAASPSPRSPRAPGQTNSQERRKPADRGERGLEGVGSLAQSYFPAREAGVPAPVEAGPAVARGPKATPGGKPEGRAPTAATLPRKGTASTRRMLSDDRACEPAPQQIPVFELKVTPPTPVKAREDAAQLRFALDVKRQRRGADWDGVGLHPSCSVAAVLERLRLEDEGKDAYTLRAHEPRSGFQMMKAQARRRVSKVLRSQRPGRE